MSWFKRLCMFLFGICGLASLAALALTWVGPWTAWARSMLEVQWYLITLEVLVCLTAAGLLGCVFVALFWPRNPKETIVGEVEGGSIVVTRNAIVSQVRHVIEDDGTCKAASIRVRVRKRGNVRVSVRVRPLQPLDVIAYGDVLYQKLGAGLAEVCGETVKSVSVVFTEPVSMETLAEDAEDKAEATVAAPAEEQSSQASPNQLISVRPDVLAQGGHTSDEPAEEPVEESAEAPVEYAWAPVEDDAQIESFEAEGDDAAEGAEDVDADADAEATFANEDAPQEAWAADENEEA